MTFYLCPALVLCYYASDMVCCYLPSFILVTFRLPSSMSTSTVYTQYNVDRYNDGSISPIAITVHEIAYNVLPCYALLEIVICCLQLVESPRGCIPMSLRHRYRLGETFPVLHGYVGFL